MKKILLIATAIMMTVAANSQVVIGGAIGFGADGGNVINGKIDNFKGEIEKTDLNFDFEFSPKVGYIIDEKYEVGCGINLAYAETTSFDVLRNKEVDPTTSKIFKDVKESRVGFSVNPYARIRCFEAKGFGIWIEGVAQWGTNVVNDTKFYAYSYGDIEGRSKEVADALNNQDDDVKTSNFFGGLYIEPVLTYDINEHWILETGLNFLGFNLSGTVNKEKDKNTGNWAKENTCNFGLNITSENVIQVGLITIGVVYAF